MTDDEANDHKANHSDNAGREGEKEEGFGRTREPEDHSRVPHKEPPWGHRTPDHTLAKRMLYQLS